MANADLLQTFLQLHICTDSAAVSNLPLVVNTLSTTSLESSPHLAKWTNRINSLIHSREPGARWAGITLALLTSRLSRSILISNAQNWVSVVLPTLFRNESLAIWNVSIRLIAFIFTSTVNLAEFQRHVVTPNIPKFSTALLSLSEKQSEEELKVLCLDTLATMIPLYPSLHRQMASNLSTVSLNFLNGRHTFTPAVIVSSASRLHACLHITGGKVGATTLWRKSVDETIVFCSAALAALRSTYATENQPVPRQTDPLVSAPLNLDRLYCGVELLCHLLRAKVERPVIIPLYSLVTLCVTMLCVTKDGVLRADVDPSLRSTEAAVAPSVLELGCSLTVCLAKCVQNRLAPHLTRILSALISQLEHPTSRTERISIIKLLPALFSSCFPSHEPLMCGRIIKRVLPTIASLLSVKAAEETMATVDIRSKKGKKRARGYEGDEVFKVENNLLCGTAEDAEHVLAALDALPYLLRVPKIPAYLQSLSSRLLLSLLLLLPKLPANAVAHDPGIKGSLLRRVKETCIEFTSRSSVVLCKSLPLVASAIVEEDASANETVNLSNQNGQLLDLMLHPRLPPSLRPLPALDAVALWQTEEGVEEHKARESLRLRLASDILHTNGESREMDDVRFVRATNDAQQIIRSEHQSEQNEMSVHPPGEQPLAPIVLPAVPNRPATPLVVQPTSVPTSPPKQDVRSNAILIDSRTDDAAQGTTRLITPLNPEHREQQLPETQLVQQPDTKPIQQQPYRSSETLQMVIDNEDGEEDDEDIEMPVLDPASPTDSEME
ncbi:hypothetical protein ACEPAG_6491 [Sanghuangporus baumii]